MIINNTVHIENTITNKGISIKGRQASQIHATNISQEAKNTQDHGEARQFPYVIDTGLF